MGSLDSQIPPGRALEEFHRAEFQSPRTPDSVELASVCQPLGGVRVTEDIVEGGESRSVFGSEGRALGVVEAVISAQHPMISRVVQSAPFLRGPGSGGEIFAPHQGCIVVVLSLRVQPLLGRRRRQRRRWWGIVRGGGGDGVKRCRGDDGGRVELIHVHSLWSPPLALRRVAVAPGMGVRLHDGVSHLLWRACTTQRRIGPGIGHKDHRLLLRQKIVAGWKTFPRRWDGGGSRRGRRGRRPGAVGTPLVPCPPFGGVPRLMLRGGGRGGGGGGRAGGMREVASGLRVNGSTLNRSPPTTHVGGTRFLPPSSSLLSFLLKLSPQPRCALVSYVRVGAALVLVGYQCCVGETAHRIIRCLLL